jgi:uncharacterized membrane protein YdbT with pleckstrin-like domain
MSYIERVLQPGETVAYRAQLHWVLMAPGMALMAVAVGIGAAGLMQTSAHLRLGPLSLAALAVALGGVQMLRAWVRRISTEIVVTDRRIIVKTGLIGRRSVEMNLDKVESVLVDQGIVGRLLDFGTLVIRGVGSGLEPVTDVASPFEFHRYVNARA